MPDEPPPLDLSALDFGPAWARESAKPSRPHPGGGEEPREDREPREREHRGGPRRGGDRDRRGGRSGRFERHEGRGRRPGDRPGERPRREQRGPEGRRPHEPEASPLPWLKVSFSLAEGAAQTFARQVKHTGRTYSLFDLARVLLRTGPAYRVELNTNQEFDAGPFFVCAVDGSVWLSEADAVRHVLRHKLEAFYSAESVTIEPPKGNFNVIAVCGMSGTLLGPPNLHDYQRKLRELHTSRFGHMAFEEFTSRIRMERDPALIEQWKEQASVATHYRPSSGDESAPVLKDLGEVENHFRLHHGPSTIQPAKSCSVPGDFASVPLAPLLRKALEIARREESRFPLRLAQALSKGLAACGLRFHKSANRTTYVSASRARYLDLEHVPVSDSIRRILGHIRAHKGERRADLLEALAPLPEGQEPVPVSHPAPPPEAASAAPTPPAEGAEGSASPVGEEPSPAATESAPPPPAAPVPEMTPEQAARAAVVRDLLWLTHEGYVIEYADGRLEAVEPPKNPPAPKTEAAAPAPVTGEGAGSPASSASAPQASGEATSSPTQHQQPEA